MSGSSPRHWEEEDDDSVQPIKVNGVEITPKVRNPPIPPIYHLPHPDPPPLLDERPQSAYKRARKIAQAQMEIAAKAKKSKNPGCCVCGDKSARGCPGCVDAKDKNGGQGEIQHYCIVDSFPIGQDGHRHVCEKMYNRLYLARASYLCKSMVIQGRMIMFKKAVDAISDAMEKPRIRIPDIDPGEKLDMVAMSLMIWGDGDLHVYYAPFFWAIMSGK